MKKDTRARIRRYLTVFVAAVTGVWFLGLLAFASSVAEFGEAGAPSELEKTDAIVVLTGGSERIGAGLQLLAAGKAKKLFISGVHPGLNAERLLTNQIVPRSLRDCCILLGHEAETTMGNAEETLTWMSLENFHSLLLVTANYHMPRSLLIFRTAMPGYKIVPYPIAPDSVKLESWWRRSGTANLLITEYNKYLLAVLRLWLGRV